MINVRMQPQELNKLSPKITVVGVGGAGGNAVNNMIASNLEGVEFLVCNTDAQALEGSTSPKKLQLGVNITSGLGAGSRPEIGRAAAEESMDEVLSHLDGANMVFVTAGMGGGTGSGAAPVIARAAREKGILTVGVVTKPFHFEGAHRMRTAEAAIAEMQEYVDTLIIIPNQNLFRIANEKTTFAEAFKMADGVLQSGVRGVTDLMVMPGLINLDFADIRCAMLEMGKAMMGTGEATGERRAIEAAEAAINNPLLDDVSMKGARGVIINITGGYDMTLFEADEACNRIRDEVDPDANIIFGSTFDESLEGTIRVSVVATGIEAHEMQGYAGTTSSQPTSGGYYYAQKPAQMAKPATTAQRAEPKVTEQYAAVAKKEVYQPQPQPQPQPQQVAQTPVQTPTETSKVEELEAEMYEQAEFVAQQQLAQTEQPQQPQVATPNRAMRHGEAFIPPAPIEAAYASQQPMQQVSPSVAQQPQQAQQVQQPQQPAYQPVTPTQPQQPVQSATAPRSTFLTPPVPGAGANKKRTPSLFERFTGLGGGASQDEMAEETQEGSKGSQQGETSGGFGSLRATTSPSRQGSLNIDAPSQPGVKEDDLDIPAFLRRQAN